MPRRAREQRVASRVFIDGRDGTTGLQIHERLRARKDLTLLEIEPGDRKRPDAKRAVMLEADLVVLCLPDAAATEAVALAGPETRILDASSAHRVQTGWIYGMPELEPERRARIRGARRVSNPGCYPTGFLLAVRPLVDAGVLPANYPVSVHAQSGYSGGGKKLIQAFEAHPVEGASPAWTVRPYALDLQHKHVPEMYRYSELDYAPVFCPSVGHYYQGMLVSIPLQTRMFAQRVTPEDVHGLLARRYATEPFVRVMPLGGTDALEAGCLNATALNGTNMIELFVFGRPEQLLLVARLDNLGKGAAGAAVQNLNLMLGCEEGLGLNAP
jgi:N-acetyl-gamma-glutamyl-phosphate reductase